MTEHGSAAAVELLPVPGLPEFRPGDDLAAALAEAAPWLRDDDVVVAGRQPEEVKWGALQGCAFVISPSAWESFSLVVLEAWLRR